MSDKIHILVAGGAGYIGAQTCKHLAKAGYVPVTLDNLSTGYAKAVKWGPLVEADISDKDAVLAAIKAYDIKACIHFAAFSLVGESTRDPAKYYDNNVTKGMKLVQTLNEGGVKAMVFSSTAAVYGIPQDGLDDDLIDESCPKRPINPYGGSKLAFEHFLYWMGQAHDFRSVILRYFNAAGADPDGEIGESHVPETHLLPLVCKAALGTGDALKVFGTDYPTHDGTAIRDYIHVCDLADAHIAALVPLLAGAPSVVYNVGTGLGVSVLDVINTAKKALGLDVPHSLDPRREGDPKALVASVSKIEQQLNWKAKRSDLLTILKDAAHWQKNKLY